MMHTLQYTEINQAVPGATRSPVYEGGAGGGGANYGECQVPSPSQWSDPCYSPPSFHSPQHLPIELEKIKEEPYSPPSMNSSASSPLTYLNLPASPNASTHSPMNALHMANSPYGRPSQPGRPSPPIKQDSYESCINLSDLLNENQNLLQQHHVSSSPSPPYVGGGYPDHPLLRGCLEDSNGFQKMQQGVASSPPPQQSFDGPYIHPLEDQSPQTYHKMSPPQQTHSADEGLNFLESLVDVKREPEDNFNGGSSCGSPAVPSPGGAAGQAEVVIPQSQSQTPCPTNILATVEILAQEHNRKEVQSVSESLNIPIDPAQWSVEDVRAWLKLQASQLNLPPLSLDFWTYGGPSLLKLTEQQFRTLAPNGGELLYAKLEIWRDSLKSSTKFSSPSSSPTPSMMDHQRQLYANFLHHQQVQQEANHLMMLSPSHHMAQYHHQQQQHAMVQSGGSSPSGSAPSSPPLSLTSLSQVPAPVAQVSQQQQQQQQQNASSPAPPSPQQQHQGSKPPSAVYLDESCLDMTTLLQQQQVPAGNPKISLKSPTSSNCSSHDDAFDSEDEVEEETCSTGGSGRGGTHIHLWQFLKELLQQPQLYGSCIRWLDRQKGVFKIEDSVRVARLWGKRKNRPAMNYDKLSRSIRQYYKKGIMKKTERSQRLVYQFCHPYCL